MSYLDHGFELSLALLLRVRRGRSAGAGARRAPETLARAESAESSAGESRPLPEDGRRSNLHSTESYQTQQKVGVKARHARRAEERVLFSSAFGLTGKKALNDWPSRPLGKAERGGRKGGEAR